MPNINISDERGRDAVVKAESVRARAEVRYIGPRGQPAYSRRLLKATINQSYDALVDQFKDDEALAQAMVKGDPEVDVEQVGQFLWGLSRVYVNPKDELVYRVTQTEIVRNVDGSSLKPILMRIFHSPGQVRLFPRQRLSGVLCLVPNSRLFTLMA